MVPLALDFWYNPIYHIIHTIMSTKETLSFQCPCEKEHVFQETFRVEGAGETTVQVRCPHQNCPGKSLLTFEIPWELSRDEEVLKGGGNHPLGGTK